MRTGAPDFGEQTTVLTLSDLILSRLLAAPSPASGEGSFVTDQSDARVVRLVVYWHRVGEGELAVLDCFN